MIDVVPFTVVRQSHLWMLDCLMIDRSYRLAAAVLLFQIVQLHIQYGSLNLIHAAVDPFELKLILTCRTIVGNAADGLRQLFIISRYGSRIAQCAEVLARIKAVGGSITETSRAPFTEPTAMCLRIVFNKKQLVTLTEVTNQRSVRTAAIKMYQHDGACPLGDGGFNKLVVQFKGIDVRLHQHRGQPVFSYCKNRCNVCIGRNNNLITRFQLS